MSVKEKRMKNDFSLIPYEWAILNKFQLYKVNAERAEMERWSTPITNIDYVEYNRKALSAKKIKFNPTEGGCPRG